MKKLLPLIIAPLLILGLAVWQKKSYSATNLPYPKPETCQQEYKNEMFLMQTAWSKNIDGLTAREIPASNMVDDAFESTRTYRCWMEYLCRAVRFSAVGTDTQASAGLTTDLIGKVSGCAVPENIVIPGITLHYLPQCKIGSASTQPLVQANELYNACRQDVELSFGDPVTGEADLAALPDKATAFIVLEKKLKSTQARQKAAAVEIKLAPILNKMHAMEVQAEALKNLLIKLDALIPCYIEQCT